MSRDVTLVVPDERRGHIALVCGRTTALTLTSDRDYLDVWQYESCRLDVPTALALSHELESWAGWRMALAAKRATA